MKSLNKVISIVALTFSFSTAIGNYNRQLHRLEKDMLKSAQNLNAVSGNPFQTGSALSDYFISEQQVILNRDNWFILKANDLETTQDVADYHWRLGIMKSHANNMLITLVKMLEQRIESDPEQEVQEEQKKDLDELLEECEQSLVCFEEKLNNRETKLENIFADNFELSKRIFAQTPFMQVLEVGAIYQLIQLTQLEVLYGKNTVGLVEFDIFYDKQRELYRAIDKNADLTPPEHALHRNLVKNVVNRWKKRILQRKYDAKKEFTIKANELLKQNQEILSELKTLKQDNSELFERKIILRCPFGTHDPRRRKHPSCDTKLALKSLSDFYLLVEKGEFSRIGEKETQLPKYFWKELD